MIRQCKAWWRLWVVAVTVCGYGLDQVLPKPPLFWRLSQRMLWVWPARRRYLKETLGVRLRLALVALGPMFVKFGQALSTRYDVLGEEVAAELALLQDQVPPILGTWALDRIEALLGLASFASVDKQPLAAASIAQVHAAVLLDGESVVIKLLRPDVHAQLVRDIACMRLVAAILTRWWSLGARLRLLEVVDEFERFTMDELDLRREAANASRMRRAFERSDVLYIPKVYWDYCQSEVMVLERIAGIPVGDVDALQAAGVDMACLAQRGVEIFFTQVLRDRFFHADMHPGNIFIDVHDPKRPNYIAIDFGIVGSLTERDQRYLAENIMAFFQQDYAKVARLHVASGWVPKGVDVVAFETTIRTLCEPMFQKPLAQLSLGRLLAQLLYAAQRFDMQVQPQLVLLQKTLLSIEGLGQRLYPDLDLWATAQPLVADWLKQQLSVKQVFKTLQQRSPLWVQALCDAMVHGEMPWQAQVPSKNTDCILTPPVRGAWRGYARGVLLGAAAMGLCMGVLPGLGALPMEGWTAWASAVALVGMGLMV